ncbi:F-box protein [Panicum miliaceum]|uniref:F-box protein n=1 Tax=Panicum miliaceum TaxID=4540 RepID=A0A3L6QDT9_PANMI|nr:F-box protein [Panicum miliaceum]
MEAVRQQEEAEGKRPRVEAAQPDDGSQLETSTCCRRTWCKKFGELGMKPEVLKVASAACVSVRAGRWCPAADSFLHRCGDAGNADANFQLGMIEFYCLRRRRQGWSRMKAAMRSGHAEATFAAAVIRLNGTGSPAVDDRGPRAAARLFLRAASSGHIGALRDLGFCARYCSRACQAVHWRMGHRAECVPVHQWLLAAMGNQAAAHVDGALAAAAAPGNVAGFPI